MSNITLSAQLKYNENYANVDFEMKAIAANDGDKYNKQVQTVSTTAEPLDLGDIPIPGQILIINRDGNNNVKIRTGATEADLILIGPGLMALFQFDPTGGLTPHVIAENDDCVIEYLLIEA